MKKRLKIILIALIIFNLIISGFLLLDIQAFEAPKTEVLIKIKDVNSEELVIETTINIKNDNSFGINVKNFEVISNTEDNKEIGRIKIKGGNIPGKSSKEFSSEDNFVLKNEKVKILKNKVLGKIGLKFFGFIQKTIPLEINIKTSIEEVFKQIKQPAIEVTASFTEIFSKGLNFSTKIDVFNPTHLLYNIEKIYFNIEKQDGTNVGKITLTGDIINPNSKISLYSNGTVFFNALDTEVLWLRLTGVAGAKVAGIYKSFNLSVDTSIIIPDVKEFVFGGEEIDFQIPVQFKIRLNGIHSNIGLKMYNPSNVTLIGKDLLCSLYRVDNEKKTLLGQKVMDTCQFPPNNWVCVKTDITIPYIDYFLSVKGRIIPDWIILRIEGDFYIAGTNQSVPLSLNAIVDPNLIREKDLDEFKV